MELFLSVLQIPILIVLIIYIRKLHSDSMFKNSYYFLLSLRISSGFIMGIIYFNYYQKGDILIYHNDLNQMSSIFNTDVANYFNLVFKDRLTTSNTELLLLQQPRALFFLRLISPFYLFSGNNFWILTIYLSLFCFSGIWILSDTLIRIFKLNSFAVLASFFLFPTFVFWTSGVLKESIAVGLICYIVSITLNILNGQKRFWFSKLMILFLFLWVLFKMKYYYFAVLSGVLIPYCLVKFLTNYFEILRNNKKFRIALLVILIVVLGSSISLLHPVLSLNHLTQSIYNNYIETLRVSNNQNVYYFEGLSNELTSFIPHIPKALSFGILGPYLWHCKKVISFIVGIEHFWIFILLVAFLLKNFKKETFQKIDLEVISVSFYVGVLAVFIAFASPNWGALVRYKVAYLPFFLLIILHNNPILIQLENKLTFLKRSDK